LAHHQHEPLIREVGWRMRRGPAGGQRLGTRRRDRRIDRFRLAMTEDRNRAERRERDQEGRRRANREASWDSRRTRGDRKRRPDLVAESRWCDLPRRLGDPASFPAEGHLTPALLASD